MTSTDLKALCDRIGIPGIIDVHTHFLPSNVLVKVWEYFDTVGPTFGLDWPITYRHEEAERLETLRSFGVRAFTSMVYPHRPGMAQWLNAWSADFARQHRDCLHTATMFPEPGARNYVAEALADGARVFKVHVQVGDFDPLDPQLKEAWGLLAETQTPVVIHAGSGPLPGRFTGPEPISRLLQQHPRLSLIVAHMGMPEYSQFLDLAERYEDVRLDTTMNFTDFFETMAPFPRKELPRVGELGHKILFGSDFPNIPYPYGHAIEALADLGLGDRWLAAVLHNNAAQLFSLNE